MKVPARFAALALALAVSAGAAEIGQPAPDFTLVDHEGKTVKLAELKGKIVVLEWTNPQCPFVKRHVAAATVNKLVDRYAGKNVVFFAVNSSHMQDRAFSAEAKSAANLTYPILVDQEGLVGKLYGARTTPHMFVIDTEGKLAYDGAIDDDQEGKTGAAARNYVAEAVDSLLAGVPVRQGKTKPYGCSVKYKT